MGETVAEEKKSQAKKSCDNHPDNEATLVTDGNGAHSEIALCDVCRKISGRV